MCDVELSKAREESEGAGREVLKAALSKAEHAHRWASDDAADDQVLDLVRSVGFKVWCLGFGVNTV